MGKPGDPAADGPDAWFRSVGWEYGRYPLALCEFLAYKAAVAYTDWKKRDPEGNPIVFGLAKTPAGAPSRDIRGPLQHITFGSTDLVPMEKFYADTLGMALTDRVNDGTGRMTTCFVRSTHEHHTVGMFLKPEAGLDHHSYEAGEWTAIRDWGDHLGALHEPIVWGPGRHGPGNNLFIFIKDPDGNMIEISAEIEYVRDRPVQEWKHEPYTLNSWGPAIMRI